MKSFLALLVVKFTYSTLIQDKTVEYYHAVLPETGEKSERSVAEILLSAVTDEG
jgi:hypothetical protein